MERPQVTRVLKTDSMGRVERVDGPLGPVVRRVACGNEVPGTGVVARILMRRERAALLRLHPVTGIAQLVSDAGYAEALSDNGRAPRRAHVLTRTWVEGNPLQEAGELPENFFELLEELVRELHACGVCHNDLHKEANILVGADGYPALVDFQLASVHDREDRHFRVRVTEDLRHVEKHRYKYVTCGGHAQGDGRARPPRERSTLARTWIRFGKPVYVFVTRKLFHKRGGERGRPKTGPWPRWTPPLASRTR